MERSMETGSEIPRPSIGEPHFEEDWTLREARPVIPLETIEAAKHRGFAFRLVGAFAVAVLLGAITALVSIRMKQTPAITQEGAVAIADDKPSLVPEETLDPESTAVTDLDDQPLAEEETRSSQSVTLAQPKAVARPIKPIHEVKTKSEPEPLPKPEVNNNATQPRPVLVDQWEERRMRRVLKRERRERRAQRNRDLMRIDELFEGHRPN
jgi:hypothetical protein